MHDHYTNANPTFPFFELKYKSRSLPISIPMFEFPLDQLLYPEEIIGILDDRIVNNIIPDRYVVTSYGRCFDCCLNSFINLVDNGHGYKKFKVSYYKNWNEIAYKDVYIHRAVLMTFRYIYGCENTDLYQVDHINGDKSDNRLCNLEWVSHQENVVRALKTGLRDVSLINPSLDINDPNQPIRIVCSLLQDGWSNVDIAKKMNIEPSTVASIKRGILYSWISKDYDLNYVYRPQRMEDSVVRKICEYLQQGYGNTEIAKKLNVKLCVVTGIKTRRNYTNISKDYIW